MSNKVRIKCLLKNSTIAGRIGWYDPSAGIISFDEIGAAFTITPLQFNTQLNNGSWGVVAEDNTPEYAEAPIKSSEWTDKHYDHYYTHKLTPEEIESGVVKLKIDPYFVNSLWGLNSVEKSGAGFHCLKTLSRMPNNKNSLSREWDAMIGQSTRAKQLLDE